ncbi:hypothetical protein [Echinicola vietnamensis]|uniref:Outer membrane protein beta-barrel domain-containing protein n=1 Tax=Echinicola vietnamensis (strain DSM 17526 / LMG 23754 / KMM 6221) TaxID=926556 RepID=L0FZ11_ECHVK|nr:hypothetical protein [Echinicola vietnamensis]AGA77991.1 hypothetical protein Echvi_1726 [Echinicola vietnamensis DSM 17526]
MKKILLLFIFSLPVMAFAQEQSIGLRIGEPISITYKTFLDDKVSFEGMLGRGSANSTAYYRKVFDSNKPMPGAFYLNHSAGGGISLNGRVAYHEDITAEFDITEGTLLAFGGGGLQFRSINVDYAYQESPDATMVRYENKDNIDFGLEVFGGGEYYFEDQPISVFAELGLMMEIADRPGHVKLQGGIGARYHF